MRDTTDRQLKADIESLLDIPRKKTAALPPREARGLQASQRGDAEFVPPDSGVPVGGIASPITEDPSTEDQASREYHPTRTLQSTDGIFTFELRALARVRMRDAHGNRVELRFRDIVDGEGPDD